MVDKIAEISVYLHNGWTQSLNLYLDFWSKIFPPLDVEV